MADLFPESRITGLDLSDEAIGLARAGARDRGLSNAHFEARDVADPGAAGAFDLITVFDAIHDQARPAEVLRAIALALRPGGTFLMQDISRSSHLHEDIAHPFGPLLYTISC